MALVTLPTPVRAQEGPTAPQVRAHLEPGSAVTVGQPLQIVVEVVVPSYFMRAPRFADLDIKNALVLFNDRGTNFTEREAGVTWAGQGRSYTVYPQVPGNYDVGALRVEVVYFDDGRTEATVVSAPLRFEATLPAEAEGLGYFIATSRLSLVESYDPLPDTIRVGEAFVRTITATVDDALSMVVPPLVYDAVPGLAIYADPPKVDDTSGERGAAIVGTRVESATYLAQEPGDYRVPAVELSWWDVDGRVMRQAVLPGRPFVVVPNPMAAAEIALPPDSLAALVEPGSERARVDLLSSLRRWGPTLLAALVLGYVLLRWVRHQGPRWRDRRATARHARKRSEQAYYRRFRAAAGSGDARATARTFMAWLDRTHAGSGVATFAAFVEAAADAELETEAHAVDQEVYGSPSARPTASWSGSRLARRVDSVRHARARGTGEPGATTLQPLNPAGPAN